MSLFAAEPDEWLGRDKALHFGASAGLAMAGYAGTAVFSTEPTIRLGAGGLCALGLGVGKEIADRYTGGHPSWRDMGWNAIGTATGLATAWLVDRYLLQRLAPRPPADREAALTATSSRSRTGGHSLVISPAHVGK